MKKVHVKIGVRPWRGDRQATAEDGEILLVDGIEINGLAAYTEGAEVSVNLDGFMTIAVRRFDADGLSEEALSELKRQHNVLVDQFTADDWLEGTTDELLLLPVSSIEFVENER